MRQFYQLFAAFLFFSPGIIYSQSFNMGVLARMNPDYGLVGGHSALWGYTAPDNREYAILGTYRGTYFYDVTDVNNVVEIDFLQGLQSGWREMKTYSHYAYIVSESPGSVLQIVDLQYLPDSIHYLGQFTLPGHSTTHSISQSGPYLYLNGANSSFGNGTVIADLSVNPEQPILRGKWDEYYVHDSRIVNDTIWACNIGDGYVSVIDATNKDSLTTIAQWNNLPNPSPHNIALTNDRKYALVTDENLSPGRLKVWDVSNLSNILYLTTWIPQGFENSVVHNVELYDSLAVIAYYSAGVRVVNISNPSNPQEVAYYDTYPDNNSTNYAGCWGVYMFPSGTIIGSDRKYGLFVLRQSSNIIPGPPRADFEADHLTSIVLTGDSISFHEFSAGDPIGWEWTVSGPENHVTYNRYPKFGFNTIGDYTIKLKVNNSFGSDSLTRVNYIKVIAPPLSGFQFSIFTQNINVSPTDTSKERFYWYRAYEPHPLVNYKVRINKFGDTDFRWFTSDNNGQDSVITFRNSFLDSLATDLGGPADTVRVTLRAFAYNSQDSLQSGTQLLVYLIRTSVGISIISSEIPGEFKLDNNYPNPFNPETNIQYQLPKAAFVSIKLYDIMGREVRSLVNERHDAGYYNYRFNANGLSSGVYFYKIQAGDFSDIKRMMLIK